MNRRHVAAWVILVLFGAAAALVLARRAASAYPVSDIALIELYTREAARGRLLVGPYSRFGWHHPGPALFYLLAPGYALGGGSTSALHAAALVVSLAAIGVAVWTIRGDEDDAARLAVVSAIGLLAVRLPPLLISPWNPHIVIVPAVALLAAASAAAAGSAAALPVVVVLASFLVQTDAALVPFACAVAAVSVVGICWSSGWRTPDRRPLLIGAALLAVLWCIPIVEQLAHSPGNLTRLWRFFLGGAPDRLPFHAALGVWADAITAPLRPGFTLARGLTIEPAVVAPHVVLAGALTFAAAAAAALAARWHARVLAWFAALSVLSSAVALWSVTRIAGAVSDHFAFWTAAIGGAEAAAIFTTAVAGVAPRYGRALAVAGIASIVGLGVQGVARTAAGAFPVTVNAPSAPNFAASIRAYLDAGRVERPLFRIDQESWGLAAAILLELDREGIAYAVEDDWNSMFPDRFRAIGDEDAELWLAAAGRRPELARRRGNVTIDASSFIHVEAVRMRPAGR